MAHIVSAATSTDSRELGGKAAALAKLASEELPIPPWFVVSPGAFEASVEPDVRDRLDGARSAEEAARVVAEVTPAASVRQAIDRAVASLAPGGERLAVRSSAVDEDGTTHSFAGQMDSFLFVSPEAVADRVAAVWRSAFSERILAYRHEHGLSLVADSPAVLVQRMIDADVAGVAFGADPVSGRRGVAVVSALYGLGTSLVSGECDADTYRVDRDDVVIERAVVDKPTAHRIDPDAPEGVRAVAVDDAVRGQAAISDEQAIKVAELARATGMALGRPQDIEWALKDGHLYLLQSRPITSLGHVADPDGRLIVWDNSNIAESYGGITTPLTFTFARRAYEEVYRAFARILKVPERRIEDEHDTFYNMLGLISGRVYYNLNSWYRALAMLPGFSANRRFMEQMMGVSEGMPAHIIGELDRCGWRERLVDRWNLLRSAGGLVVNHWLLERKVAEFHRRLDAALSDPGLRTSRADELVAHYRDLERRLLTRWDAPLINDFLCMIFFGVLRTLVDRWCNGDGETLHNNLMCSQGGMISAEPARRMVRLAKLAADDPEWIRCLCDDPLAVIRREMAARPEFVAEYDAYLERFGDRCLDELKLESATLHDDPLLLLRSVGQYARQVDNRGAGDSDEEDRLLREAEASVAASLAGRPVKKRLFAWVLGNARRRVRDRENLRFERTRLFGRVRRVFVELGQRLYADGVLDHPRDVFYLELHEVLGFVEGTATVRHLDSLARLRRAEFEGYAAGPVPADRFETRGAVDQGNTFRGPGKVSSTPDGDSLRGVACCPGIVRGPVRVIDDPRNATLNAGEILVAERTDPGWIMLFPNAAGLLVERGSLLSHSAIVSREMGIPSVVSLSGVTQWLADGDWVEFDGSTGEVRKVSTSESV